MTAEKAQEIIKKYPNAVDFTKRSHFEELSPLLEVHVEVVEVKKSDFHALPGNTYYPRKETTDRFGNAAGISFARVDVSTRKEDGSYIARAIPQEVGPDGKMIQWAPAEYEFDPAIRAEEDILRDEENAEKYGKQPKYQTDRQKKMLELQYRKVARRRADTGARAAAIISAIGMPTGFKDLFQKNEPETATRVFLFSRVIVNSKNEMVLQRALDSMFTNGGTVDALYGGKTQQIESPEEPAREVSGALESQNDDGGEFDDFEGADSQAEELDEKSQVAIELEQYLASGQLPQKGVDLIQPAVEDPDSYTLEQLQDLLERAKKAYNRATGTGGAA